MSGAAISARISSSATTSPRLTAIARRWRGPKRRSAFATHSEFRLGEHGDPRVALLKARAAGVTVTLSSDATLDRAAQHVREHAVHLEHDHSVEGTETEELPPLGFREVIEMATINGARALGLDDITGSLTPGKRADIILIRTNDLNIAPLANIETTVVQSATPANVDTVMVDGRIVKRNGRLLDYDVPGIVERAETSARRIRTAAGGILKPVSEAAGNPVFTAAC